MKCVQNKASAAAYAADEPMHSCCWEAAVECAQSFSHMQRCCSLQWFSSMQQLCRATWEHAGCAASHGQISGELQTLAHSLLKNNSSAACQAAAVHASRCT